MSRLAIEGLYGAQVGPEEIGTVHKKKRILGIFSHGEARRTRTVVFSNGTRQTETIYDLVGWLIKKREGK